MGAPGAGPVINPTLCVGFVSFVIGTAIGIGIGVAIANSRYRNSFGGGFWVGKRKKRSLENLDEKSFQIIGAIEGHQELYDED